MRSFIARRNFKIMNQKKSETYGFMRKGKKGCLSYWVVPYKIAWHSERETIADTVGESNQSEFQT